MSMSSNEMKYFDMGSSQMEKNLDVSYDERSEYRTPEYQISLNTS
jgi:hypothetical protein